MLHYDLSETQNDGIEEVSDSYLGTVVFSSILLEKSLTKIIMLIASAKFCVHFH